MTERKYFPAASGVLLLLAIILSPLPLGSNRPLFVAVLMVMAGLALTIWALQQLRSKTTELISWKYLIGPALCTLPLLGWSVVQAFSSTYSIDPMTSRLALLQLLSYIGFFLLAYQAGRSSLWARRILKALALSALFYALYAIISYVNGNAYLLWLEKANYVDSLTGTFVNRNAFAAYCGLGLLACLGLLFAHVGREIEKNSQYILLRLTPPLWACAGGACFLSICLLLSNSRAGLISVVLAVACLWIGLFITRILPRKALLAAALLGMIAAAGLVVVAGDQLRHRFEHGLVLEDERSSIWAATGRMIKDAPITGQGLGTYPQLFRQYRDSDIGMNYSHAHSTYLERAAESGLPATLIFYLGLLFVGLRLCIGVFTRRQNRIYPVIALAAFTQAAAHSLVDFSFQMPANAIILAMLLGVGYAQSFSSEDKA